MPIGVRRRGSHGKAEKDSSAIRRSTAGRASRKGITRGQVHETKQAEKPARDGWRKGRCVHNSSLKPNHGGRQIL